MVLYSDLRNWENGNISDIDRAGLIAIARHFEYCIPCGYKNVNIDSDIEYDIETDEDVHELIDQSIKLQMQEDSPYHGSMAKMAALAKEYGIDVVNFHQFWQMRFPDHGPSYMEDWARRLRDGNAREQADHETMRALHKCGLLE